jgi:gliding motility-associated-like protein
MKKWILLLITCLGFQVGFSQNLIPDGEVSLHHNVGCPSSTMSLQNADYWYSVGNTTADFFLPECQYNDPNGAWTFFTYPYEGNGFLGFFSTYKKNYLMSSEVFATALTEPLKANKPYFFSVDIRYRGKWLTNNRFPLFCPTEPPMGFEIYTSIDTVRAEMDQSNTAKQVFGNHVLTLNSTAITDTIITNLWTTLNGCFYAVGGETHIGFSMSLDSFPPVFPCISTSLQESWFSLQYYNADNFKLIPFPSKITDTLQFCKEDKKLEFDIANYFGDIAIKDLQPIWSDGIIGTKRTFTEGGFYNLVLNYECGNTEVELFIDEKKCEATAFVPNTFTPNFDGHNDELLPFFSADFPITNYEFMVFDRWGNIFYRSENYDGFTGWDGTANGKAAQNGVYVWALKFDLITPDGTKSYQLSGDVLLVR